ncbi:hypothetical protein Pyn_00919 [Prunus yedoensis var. nudiflora]|uniref:Uncharacterized protein n=1 Tax=Prunus yedoensis var. nudiflora TaxID=2094558 RepID=A0A314ZD15_PRUYE|nr:hypothetical protein Pyn_00919 [Prunus yedoensis var. nudiflora]
MVEGSPKVAADPEKRQQKLRERREREKASWAKKAQAQGTTSTAKGHTTEKCPREYDSGVAELEKRRRGLETSIHDVMGGGGTVVSPFELDHKPRLLLGLEELFPEGTEDIDFAKVRR